MNFPAFNYILVRSAHTRPLEALAKLGKEAFMPRFMNGRFRRPLIGKRRAANIRKYAIKNGTYGSFSPETGVGWDPAWDKPKAVWIMRPPKGHLRQRDRQQRFEKIEKALAEAPEKIQKYKQARKDDKPQPGLETLWKKITGKANKRTV
uniref:Large ribosomal subunit protein mL59 domain-containing protein n=1 Tax=Fibrocapsa japonica TaxID=94617 RepID=A0A7S2UWN1_9STRA|mmetsp:Transcript_17428/g.25448  ORF Transcript_17428/g.25448 Transcript_17428/m.25448 type:complete len:149 (+) Transcript_17428:120-566(+)